MDWNGGHTGDGEETAFLEPGRLLWARGNQSEGLQAGRGTMHGQQQRTACFEGYDYPHAGR